MSNPRALLLILPGLFFLSLVAFATEPARPVQAGSPDVLVENIYYYQETPGGPTENVELTLQIVVANAGESGTGSFALDFYREREDPPSQSDIGDATCSLDPMAPTSTQQCNIEVTYLAAGEYRFWLQLDRHNQVWESNESNNISGPNYLAIDDDSDVDTVGDQYDNCRLWPNPTQSLPARGPSPPATPTATASPMRAKRT